MKKIAYIGLAVILAVAVTAYYKNKVSERKKAYQAMANEVEMAIKEMTDSKYTKEKLVQRSNSFSSVMEVFSKKVSSSERGILEKLQNAHSHLKLAIEAFPPAMTEQELNEQMEEMYKKTNVTLERVDDRMMLKSEITLPDGGKRQEAFNEVAKELEESTALCKEVLPSLAKP